MLQDHLVGLHHFIGIARPQSQHVWHRPQGRQLLDGLVRRSVFTHANRVVRENVNRRDFHQRAETHARPHVIAKIKERSAERPEFRQRHSVYDRPHGMFPHAEVDVPPAILFRVEISRAVEGQIRLVGLGQVCRSANQPGDLLRQGVQRFSRGFARRHALWIGREARQVFVPAVGQLAALHLVQLICELRKLFLVLFVFCVPRRTSLGPAVAHAILELIIDSLGD